jgi:two-component system response regulator PilR (NtrC family)
LQLQTKLLRVLQEREFRRIGDTQDRKCDVRIIAASNRNLEDYVKEGGFREDLFYRLNVLQLTMPPLRERSEDIPLLVDHFYEKFAGQPPVGKTLTTTAFNILMNHPFPGNVRELENLVERCVVMGNQAVCEECLPSQVLNCGEMLRAEGGMDIPDAGMNLEAYLDGIEKRLLMQALERSGGVKKKAAELLGLTFRSFRYRLAKFGMDEE